MMKALLIGDDYIDAEMMLDGFASWAEKGCELVTYQWALGGKEQLQAVNLTLEQKGYDALEIPEEVMDYAGDADILVTQFFPVTSGLITNAPRLKVVGTLRAGVENICVDLMTERNIMVINNTGRNAQAVSDFTIGMMLAEARNIGRSHAAMKAGYWRKEYINTPFCPDLEGSTVGIIGFGMVGQLVAKKLTGFDVEVIAYDAYPDEEAAMKYGVAFVDLETLLKRSDFVCMNCRLVPETYHMLGAREFSLMKPTAFLINTARSGLIDEDAMWEALYRKRIGGAALDVFDLEPPGIDHRLVTLDNVTLTPHQAGTTVHAMGRSALRLCQHMSALFEGKAPKTWVNRGKVELRTLSV
ncbi:MAG: 2-hydroxyacid dehydrogenase [Christensenellales bacterium]|jgi:D-3-phosphoglycerate dehydrogenase